MGSLGMEQNQLFIESIYVALDDVVRACGGYKKVAGQLWPDLAADSAYARIKACLNPEKAEKLSLESIEWLLRLGRSNGVHVAATHLMRQAGYEDPIPSAPKSPKRMLLEKAEALAAQQRRLQEDIDRLDHAEALKAVN